MKLKKKMPLAVSTIAGIALQRSRNLWSQSHFLLGFIGHFLEGLAAAKTGPIALTSLTLNFDSSKLYLALDTEASGDSELQKGDGRGSDSSLKTSVFFLLNCETCVNFSGDSYFCLHVAITFCKRQAAIISKCPEDKPRRLSQVSAARNCS